MTEEKFKLDLQGIIRSVATIVAIVGAYYFDREQMNDKIASHKSEYAQMLATFNAHCNSTKPYTLDELDKRYVTRWENEGLNREVEAVRDDMKYLRDKVDKIYDKISK